MKQVIEKVAAQFGVTKKLSKEMVDSVVAGIVETLKAEEKLRINGLGTFSLKAKPARTARNPKSGEPVSVPAKTVVKFSTAKDLKDSLK